MLGTSTLDTLVGNKKTWKYCLVTCEESKLSRSSKGIRHAENQYLRDAYKTQEKQARKLQATLVRNYYRPSDWQGWDVELHTSVAKKNYVTFSKSKSSLPLFWLETISWDPLIFCQLWSVPLLMILVITLINCRALFARINFCFRKVKCHLR